jgi:hypothetical protein
MDPLLLLTNERITRRRRREPSLERLKYVELYKVNGYNNGKTDPTAIGTNNT